MRRDPLLGSLEHQPVGAALVAREHAEPGEEPDPRLPLDDEQRVDRAGAEHERGITLAHLDGEIVDVDHHLERGVPGAGRVDRDPQRRAAGLGDPAVRRAQPHLVGDGLQGDLCAIGQAMVNKIAILEKNIDALSAG